jgi:outer membrane lipoprotein-sorting protein
MKSASLLLSLALAAPVVGVAAFAPAPVHADAQGQKVLEELDRRAQVFKDVSYSASMDVRKDGKSKKVLEFDMTMKGLDKQYIVFKAPGDVAGMKILMEGLDALWMYSPEFKKVRKIAAHAQAQGFFGSEFTAEDMTIVGLAQRWEGVIAGKSGDVTTMELTPKPGMASNFSKLEIDVDKTKGGVTKIRYFDGSGQATREQTRGGWKSVEGQPFPTQIAMKNLKTGAETVITLSDIKVDLGVGDDLFSRRMLLRG